MANRLLVGWGRQLLPSRSSLKISYLFSNLCKFLAETSMYLIEIGDVRMLDVLVCDCVACYMLDESEGGCVWLYAWCPGRRSCLDTCASLVTFHCSRLDHREIDPSPNRALQWGWRKPDLPCQRLLFMCRNQGDGGHMTPQLTEVDLPHLSYPLLPPPLVHIVWGLEN